MSPVLLANDLNQQHFLSIISDNLCSTISSNSNTTTAEILALKIAGSAKLGVYFGNLTVLYPAHLNKTADSNHRLQLQTQTEPTAVILSPWDPSPHWLTHPFYHIYVYWI